MTGPSKHNSKYVKLKCDQADGVRIDNQLFGMETIQLTAKTGRIIFSEGPYDALTLIRLDEATLASCGGIFSREHRREVLKILMHLRKKKQDLRVIIWLDHDPVSRTGQKSAMELGQFLLQNGFTSHIVTFGGDVKIDINSLFLQSGEPAVRQALDQAKGYVEMRLAEIKEAEQDRELQHGICRKLICELVQGGFPVSLIKTFLHGVLPLGIVSEMIRDGQQEVACEKAADDPRPVVPLPGELCELRQTSDFLGKTYAGQGQLLAKVFNRGHTPNKLKRKKGRFELKILTAEAARSDFERVARLVNLTHGKTGAIDDTPAICCQETAKAVLSAEPFLCQLPEINQVVNCPVPVLRPDGTLAIVAGYDEETGILAQGEIIIDIPLPQAVAMIDDALADFDFQTPGDKSRAFSGITTPMHVFGGLLPGRAPVFMVEADLSQSGKGFLVKVVTAFYMDAPAVITQRSGRGIGSMQESFDAVLIAGRPFVSFDNLRGKLDECGLESFLTESTYSARIPYQPPVLIDTLKTIIFMTSNGVELTRDQSNRCCIIRIKKRPEGYAYRRYPEGDIIDHIKANQPRYLGAIYTIVKSYVEAGMKRTDESRHDFRPWCQTLDYVVQKLCGQVPLMDGHREQQSRMANPATLWMRELALAVMRDGKAGQLLETHHLADIAYRNNVELPGLGQGLVYDSASEAERKQVLLQIGRKLNTAFDSPDEIEAEIEVDGIMVKRSTEQHHDTAGKLRDYRKYTFFPKQSADGPQTIPQITPQTASLTSADAADRCINLLEVKEKNGAAVNL